MVTDPTLGRAPGHIVLNPVADEDPDGPVVHLHREADRKFPFGPLELLADAGVQM